MKKFSLSLKNQMILALILLVAFIISIICINLFYIPDNTHPHLDDIPDVDYLTFEEQLEKGSIDNIYYNATSNYIFIEQGDTVEKMVNLVDDDFEKSLFKQGITVKNALDYDTAENIEQGRAGKRNLYTFFFLSAYVCINLYRIYHRKEDFGELMHGIGGHLHLGRTKVYEASNSATVKRTASTVRDTGLEIPDKTFKDIAGLYEVKKDIQCIVDFVKNKEKYVDAGAKLPKGVILYGPPGTGKTLLAKAIAGEAGIPFLYASGSDFTEMYVGVGPKRVRELFTKARKQAPCIVFIDEIDAFGSRRQGENAEDRKTINALLTEMDGFSELDDVIVIGATNRLEDLDSALTRPGRFTDKYCVPLPDSVKERLEIIDLYIKDKKLDESVSLERLAKETVGFSPAQIEALLNEAAIISVQDNSEFINKAIIDKAMYKILMNGHQKENPDRRKEEINIVAWHEAGHALVGKLFGKEITKVTITQSTSGAGGVTFSLPEKTSLLSSEDMKHEVMELYGGRIGEYLYYKENSDKITTGASNDIERATSIIKDYVTKYGMADDIGMLNLEVCKIDKDILLDKLTSMAKGLEQETLDLMRENYIKLEYIANELIENETIYDADLERILRS